MASVKGSILLAACAVFTAVSAHGTLHLCQADKLYDQPMANPSNSNGVGWSSNDGSRDIWVDESSYKTGDIACGKDYEPGQYHAKVAAGDKVTLTWWGWAPNHRGPIMDYLGYCNGPCGNVDRTKLNFFKIQERGLIQPNAGVQNQGIWATDELFKTAKEVAPQEGSPPDKTYGKDVTWEIQIPSCLAPGNYVLRHEILAIFDAVRAQHYPRCINIEVTGNGNVYPEATPITELYNANEPGIKVRLFNQPQNYTIPGPPLYSGCNEQIVQQAVKPSSSSSSAAASTDAAYEPPQNYEPPQEYEATTTQAPAVTSKTSNGTTEDYGGYDAEASQALQTDSATDSTGSSTTSSAAAIASSSPPSEPSSSANANSTCPVATTTVVSYVTVTAIPTQGMSYKKHRRNRWGHAS